MKKRKGEKLGELIISWLRHLERGGVRGCVRGWVRGLVRCFAKGWVKAFESIMCGWVKKRKGESLLKVSCEWF